MSASKFQYSPARQLLCGASLAVIIVLAMPSEALAQAAGSETTSMGTAPRTADAASVSTASTNGDIVVTAERRSETVQKAPLSVTAVTGAQLQAQGITSVARLGTQVPGISERNFGAGETEYEMRGVSSSGGTSPTVGFYLDDIALTPPANSNFGHGVVSPDLYDISRVEVLRGPQGTLYGSSSMGGTIRVITNAPNTHEFGASMELTGSGTQGGRANYALKGMVNIPLVDEKLALRIVGTDSYNSGWIDRVSLSNFPQPVNGGLTRGDLQTASTSSEHKRSNWNRNEGVRGTLLWNITDNLTASPTVLFERIRAGGPNYIDEPPNGANHVTSEVHYQPFDVAEPYSERFQLYALPLKYSLGGVQLDSITAYYRSRSSTIADASENTQGFYQLELGATGSFTQIGAQRGYEVDRTSQFSQELRLSSPGDGPFHWLAGFYYQKYTGTVTVGLDPANAFIANVYGGNPGDTVFFADIHTRLRQYAGFGEAYYKLGDFKLTGGLRYFSYTTGGTTSAYGLLNGGTTHTPLTSSAHGFNPRINLSYVPSSNLTLYMQAAKGFRPGSANAPPIAGCPAYPAQYQPDTIWSYEAGEKAKMLGGRLTVNAAGYYENWTGIQQLVTLPCGYQYTGNAGTAHIYGGEVEATLRLSPELTISTSAGYAHATLASVVPGTGLSVGDNIQSVPRWTDTTSLVYTHHLNDDYDLIFRATDEFVDHQQDLTYKLETLPSRNLVDLRLGLSRRQRWSAFLFADNVANVKTTVAGYNVVTFFIPSLNRAVTNQPRTVGVTFNFAIGGQ